MYNDEKIKGNAMSVYVFGHRNPDSDSIVGAISISYLKNLLEDEEYIPARQGDISAETEFILNMFGGKLPELKTSVAGERVYLVDSTDKAHFQDDIDEATILGIIDHHKLGDIITSTPLECWIRPIGCSNTVVKEVYDASVDAGSNTFNFFKWVVGNITYGERKRGKKGYRNSVEVFEDREGVCGEMSVLYLAMVRAIGIRGSYVHVDVDYKGKNVNHACAMLDLKGREGFNILVDPAYREYDIRHRSFTPLTDFEAYKYFNAH